LFFICFFNNYHLLSLISLLLVKNLDDNSSKLKLPDKFANSAELREKLKNSNLIYVVKLHDWKVVTNLIDKDEIRKKILKKGEGKVPRNPDLVECK